MSEPIDLSQGDEMVEVVAVNPVNSVISVSGAGRVSREAQPLAPAPMKRRKPPRSREWKRMSKVSACTSSLFPWEAVFEILFRKSPRSLVLLQMVNKNLRGVLALEHKLWLRVFRYHFSQHAYMCTRVYSQQYPELRLYKHGLTGIPTHVGKIRSDADGASLPPEFDAAFSAFVRKAFALKVVDRCGLCGCRHRHEPYWTLGVRVCQLCMADNTISCWELVDKYGVHYYDIMRQITGRVFYFMMQVSLNQARASFFTAQPAHTLGRSTLLMFWRPHLEKVLDLPALYQEQRERRRSAGLLCALLRRLRVYTLRCRHAQRPLRSVDCLVQRLFSEEKRRACAPYSSRWSAPTSGNYPRPGDGYWAFHGAPVCKKTRHELRHGESNQALAAHLAKWEDVVLG